MMEKLEGWWGRAQLLPALSGLGEGVRWLWERGEGGAGQRGREGKREFGWQPRSLFHTKSGARLSVKCLCVPKHHYCLLRQ